MNHLQNQVSPYLLQHKNNPVAWYPWGEIALDKAQKEDKPIILDYWMSSLDKTCLIGVRSNNEKLLVKSEDEYTSPIAKIFKVETEYIIVTANSIYVVSADISTRRIN